MAAELKTRHRVDCVVHALDLAKEDAVGFLEGATFDFDIGLVVAAAGYGTSGTFLDADVPDELQMIDVNCRAVTELTHIFARRLSALGRGGIVLMSSLVAFQGVPRAATYAATKGFIQVFAEGRPIDPAVPRSRRAGERASSRLGEGRSAPSACGPCASFASQQMIWRHPAEKWNRAGSNQTGIAAVV